MAEEDPLNPTTPFHKPSIFARKCLCKRFTKIYLPSRKCIFAMFVEPRCIKKQTAFLFMTLVENVWEYLRMSELSLEKGFSVTELCQLCNCSKAFYLLSIIHCLWGKVLNQSCFSCEKVAILKLLQTSRCKKDKNIFCFFDTIFTQNYVKIIKPQKIQFYFINFCFQTKNTIGDGGSTALQLLKLLTLFDTVRHCWHNV